MSFQILFNRERRKYLELFSLWTGFLSVLGSASVGSIRHVPIVIQLSEGMPEGLSILLPHASSLPQMVLGISSFATAERWGPDSHLSV